jgi:hypothetical protein
MRLAVAAIENLVTVEQLRDVVLHKPPLHTSWVIALYKLVLRHIPLCFDVLSREHTLGHEDGLAIVHEPDHGR